MILPTPFLKEVFTQKMKIQSSSTHSNADRKSGEVLQLPKQMGTHFKTKQKKGSI